MLKPQASCISDQPHRYPLLPYCVPEALDATFYVVLTNKITRPHIVRVQENRLCR
jgi:hypothetical protein